MTAAQVEDLLTWVILGVVLGGRLGYVLFYDLPTYLANPLGIFAVWEGGMSFHGGFAGVVLAAWLFFRRHNIPILSGADLLAQATPPGLLLGRLANFVNAELWGRPTDLRWGVIFPGDAAQTCTGIPFGDCARHPSQLYEAGLEGLLLGFILLVLYWNRALKRPGLITGTFLMGYGLSRFAVEFVRQADAQFITPDNPMGYVVHLGGFGLSMGQLLSLPMIVAGLWLWRRARA
jgi:phosphatidylglycerol:prolipoprotein diacylglycerol transferase